MNYLKLYMNGSGGLYSFSGRLNRKGYFYGSLAMNFFSSMILLPIMYGSLPLLPMIWWLVDNTWVLVGFDILVALGLFVMINAMIIGFSAMARRLRDAGQSIHKLWWFLLPLIGTAILFLNLIKASEVAEND
ncbi:DUF805 domain-containing protein [Weissella muntiaci]|uniref:DUF805 domain-containing protein n=1 Tax=Weissella muntiaci TaxID=2508881 RepID=A0A6C2C4Z6_9LACO|nr:DUF805 domain-containing protein [Weissella muntiaci]TYC49071.1 DUF805 domain-containing protein [Weissella muntiaci]